MTQDQGKMPDRGLLFGIIFVSVTVIGVVVADILGLIRLPACNLVGSEDETIELAEQTAPQESLVEPSQRRAPRPKRPAKKPKAATAPQPLRPSAPATRARIVLPKGGSIHASRLPPDLPRHDILDVIADSGGALDGCLTKSIAARERVSGNLVIQITIDPWGRVSELHTKSVELERTALAHCVLRRVKSWRFPSFAGEPITVVFPLTITSGS